MSALLPQRNPSRITVACLALLIGLGGVAASDTEVASPTETEKHQTYTRIADRFKLYNNPSNQVIQSISLSGIYQGQYWSVDAAQGQAYGWENRRMFLGAGVELFHQFKAQVQVKIGGDFDPVYDGLHTAFLNWTLNASISLSMGRLDYFFFTGPDHSVGSTKISTFERGLLVNQIMPQEFVGAMLEGSRDRLSAHAGLVSGSVNEEFTDFAGGFGVLAGASYELPLFYEQGRLHLDYVFNNGNPSNNALQPYGQAVSLWHEGKSGPFGVGLELTFGHGLEARPDVFGVEVLPTWEFAKGVIRKDDAFQAVLRYQFATSNGDNGLDLQQRYENKVVHGGTGDRYQAAYAGINYLIIGNRLKLMNGVEYSVMHESAQSDTVFSGWTFLTGVRLYF